MNGFKWFGFGALLLTLVACSKEEPQNTDFKTGNNTTLADDESLLFMLEEEKLARDTYRYLDSLHNLNVFGNIASSEQKHMDMVMLLLDERNIDYNLLPEGDFADTNLQAYYNAFCAKGLLGLNEALHIGATIEDLDIYDLQHFVNESEDTVMIDTYQKLICGSGNHLRAFSTNLNANGISYEAQFLSQAEVDSILAGSHEHCGP